MKSVNDFLSNLDNLNKSNLDSRLTNFPEDTIVGWIVKNQKEVDALKIPNAPSDRIYVVGAYLEEWYNKKCESAHIYLLPKENQLGEFEQKCFGKQLYFFKRNEKVLEWIAGFAPLNEITEKDSIGVPKLLDKDNSIDAEVQSFLPNEITKIDSTLIPTNPLEREIYLRASFSRAYSLYNGKCDCGDRYNDNCAHFLSNAMIKAGFPMKSSSAKCKCGRMIRAKELLSWVRSGFGGRYRTTFRTNHNNPIIKSGYWFVYQERSDGQGHVLFHHEKNDKYSWKGTGNYPNWKVQWHIAVH